MVKALFDSQKRIANVVITGLESAAVIEARLKEFAKAKMYFTAL
jgi:hypothetical protein